MKKTISIIISILLIVLLCSCNTSNEFINPGDYLGGGQTAEQPNEVDNTDEQNNIIEAGNSDLSDLKENINDEEAIILTTNEITESGSYIIRGEMTSIKISKEKLDVHLFLDNATIKADNMVAIASEKKCTMIMTLIGENTIENNGDDVNAIHIKGSLAINGNGTLNVTSESKSAIKVTKDLSIVDATINTDSISHGITAESIDIQNATINVINAGKDGLHAECDYDGNTEDESVFTTEIGYISLVNTTYTSSTLGDGLQADTFIYIKGGTYTINTSGYFVSKTSENMTTYGLTTDDFEYIKSGNTYQKVASDYRGSSTLYALSQGCKGIKVGEIEYSSNDDGVDDKIVTKDTNYCLLIEDGTITINSTDDGIHVNSGNIIIKGGNITVSTYDDGITADKLVEITGGTINVVESYEGIEGSYVEISGGEIAVKSTDDGINAASDDASITEHIIISGGKIVVNAEGDGIDSNGSVLISGGDVIVYGPTISGNGGLDSERGVLVTGGTLFVSSTLGMIETPGSNSTQYVLSYANQTSISSNSVITIYDENDNEILSVDIIKACQSIIISLPEFELGKTYKIYINNVLVKEFTITQIISSVGTSTNTGPGGFRPGRP